jgi:hypothetical protein
MTLEIETLKSQTNSLQAYVNSNEPSSSLDNSPDKVFGAATCIYERPE